MKKLLLTCALSCAYFFSTATTKTVIGNSAQGWNTGSNFLPAGVPQNGDIVIIPLGLTLTVKGSIYGSSYPNIKIQIHGNLDFDPSGKLDLGNASSIQIFITGTITSNGTSSELIVIGGVVKYNGQNDGTVTGVRYASAATGTSSATTGDSGFTIGVLPVKLYSFSCTVKENVVTVKAKLAADSDGDVYTIQRKNNDRWEDLHTFRPSDLAVDGWYSSLDASPAGGKNFYRLQMLTIDGEVKYSQILLAEITTARLLFSAFPNPVTSQLTVTMKGFGEGKLMLVNAAGAIVIEKTISSDAQSLSVDCSALSEGTYWLRINGSLHQTAKQIIVKK